MLCIPETMLRLKLMNVTLKCIGGKTQYSFHSLSPRTNVWGFEMVYFLLIMHYSSLAWVKRYVNPVLTFPWRLLFIR